MKIAVLLSGCGVYDGVEIQEAVLSMLAIQEAGHSYQCIGLNKKQHHVINHLTGEEMPEERNMLVEAARIARGDILDLTQIKHDTYDALLIPGGFGSAKNFSDWAFKGPEGTIDSDIKHLILEFHRAKKVLIALCISPVLLAKAFEGSGIGLKLTLGTTEEPSPYDIAEMHEGIEKIGATGQNKSIKEITVDSANKIICAPCYMMEVQLIEIYQNVRIAIQALEQF